MRPLLLEHDQPDPVPALVGVGEQGKDGALGGRHPLGDRHRPGGVHHEQDEVAGPADAHLAVEILALHGEGHVLPLFQALDLERRGGANGGVEGKIVGFAGGGSGTDVAAALFLGVGARTAAGRPAGEFVEGGIQAARGEGFADLGLPAALPPGSVLGGGLGAGAFGRGGGFWLRFPPPPRRSLHLFFLGSAGFLFRGRGHRFSLAFHFRLDLLDLFLERVQGGFRLLDGAVFHPVGEGQFRGQGDVVLAQGRPAFEGRLGAGCFEDHQIRAMAVHFERSGQPGDGHQVAGGVGDVVDELPCPLDLVGEV